METAPIARTESPTVSHRIDMARALATPIRELRLGERPLFRQHLLDLEESDRYLRFGSPLSDSAIENYVDGIDLSVDTIFAVFDDHLNVSAAGHFALLPEQPGGGTLPAGDAAEFGLSVLKSARGRGLGTALFLRSAAHARNLSIGTLFMHCLSENRAMMRIARKAGMEIRQSHGEADAYLSLEPGTIASAIEEGVQRQIALFDFAVKRQLLMAKNAFGRAGAEA